MKGLTKVLLAAGAALVVLIPLYGDPRQAPVTHPEWARMLLRGLDMEEVLIKGSNASLAFDSLSWRTSQGVASDRYFRGTGVALEPGPPRLLRANASGVGEVAYRLAAPRPGDYKLRVKVTGDPQGRVGLELTRQGETTPSRSFLLSPTGTIDVGSAYLTPGVYTLSVALPAGTALESIEIVPPCLNSIEPRNGWRPTAIADTGEVAYTLLKALDLEHELPPAAPPIEVNGASFQPTSEQVLKASLKSDVEGYWLEADANGLQGVTYVELPEAGLYTIYAYGMAGGGQSWVADSCHKSVVCPAVERPESPRWRPILTAEFSAGRHSFAMTLANGAAVQRLRIEKKKDSVADYLATVARIGLDLGAPRPTPRSLALQALSFLKSKRAALQAAMCGDVVLQPSRTLVAGLNVGGGSVEGGGGPGGTVLPPIDVPGTGPGGGITVPPSPVPSLGPPPPTTTQPPASPVK